MDPSTPRVGRPSSEDRDPIPSLSSGRESGPNVDRASDRDQAPERAGVAPTPSDAEIARLRAEVERLTRERDEDRRELASRRTQVRVFSKAASKAEAPEREALRAEVERLTRERDEATKAFHSLWSVAGDCLKAAKDPERNPWIGEEPWKAHVRRMAEIEKKGRALLSPSSPLHLEGGIAISAEVPATNAELGIVAKVSPSSPDPAPQARCGTCGGAGDVTEFAWLVESMSLYPTSYLRYTGANPPQFTTDPNAAQKFPAKWIAMKEARAINGGNWPGVPVDAREHGFMHGPCPACSGTGGAR